MVGYLLNKNTIEQFKECNKTDLIEEEGKSLWEKVESGEALQNPSLLNTFFVLTFAVSSCFQL